MRTLLTGFGPFGRVVRNPSARIVAHFEQVGAPGHELTARVLPVSYARAAAEIAVLLREEPFDVALLLGVAHPEAAIRLEQFARWCSPTAPDIDGQVPEADGSQHAAGEQFPATLPLEPLQLHLTAAGVPFRLSVDAGPYVCNHTYYAALHAIATHHLPVRCLFVHVPADLQTLREPSSVGPTMPLARQIEAVGHILMHLGG